MASEDTVTDTNSTYLLSRARLELFSRFKGKFGFGTRLQAWFSNNVSKDFRAESVTLLLLLLLLTKWMLLDIAVPVFLFVMSDP